MIMMNTMIDSQTNP